MVLKKKKNDLSNFSSLYLTAWMDNVLWWFLIRVTSYAACANYWKIKIARRKSVCRIFCHMYLVVWMSNVLWSILIGSQLELRCKTTGNPELHKRARTSAEDMEENSVCPISLCMYLLVWMYKCALVFSDEIHIFRTLANYRNSTVHNRGPNKADTEEENWFVSFVSYVSCCLNIQMCSADFW